MDLGIGRGYGYDDPVRRYHDHTVVVTVRTGLHAVCHPERVHEARGMCTSCFSMWNRWMNHHPRTPNPPRRLRELGITERNENERLVW